MIEDGIEFKKINKSYLMNQIPNLNHKSCEAIIELLHNENILTLEEYHLLKYKNNKKVLVKQK